MIKKCIKIFNFFIMLFVIGIVLVSFIQDNVSKELIWEIDNKLEWENFKGIPPEDSIYIGALTYYGFKYSMSFNNNIPLEFNSNLYFIENKSWVRVQTDTLLIHEQGHFDLAAVYLIKLRRKIYMEKENIFSISDCDNIYVGLIKELDSIQHFYDIETDFSLNLTGQERWNDSIRIWLDRYEEYSDTVIYFNQ